MKFHFKKKKNLFLFGILCLILCFNIVFIMHSFAEEIELSNHLQDASHCLENIPDYPGAMKQPQIEKEWQELIQSMEMMSGISGAEVSAYSTVDMPGEVVQFYLSHAPEGGWERTLNLTSEKEGGTIIWKKDNDSAQVLIAHEEEKTIILLGCSSQVEIIGGTDIMTFSEEDGLADRSVMSIAVSPDGIAWIATRAGLSRFDGESWMTYQKEDGLPSNMLTSIVLDQDGLPWVGTDQWGYAYSDGNQWHQFKDVERVSAIDISANGDIWFASCNVSKGGVYHFDGEQLTWYQKKHGVGDKCVNAVKVGADGRIWAATKNGLSRFDGVKWNNYTVDDGLADNEVNDVAIDLEGKVWAATDQGLSCFDGDTFHTYTEEDGLVKQKVTVIEVAPDNSLWIGTARGLSHLKEEVWQNYTEDDGLPGNRILSLCVANDGKIWIGTPFDGLAILNP